LAEWAESWSARRSRKKNATKRYESKQICNDNMHRAMSLAALLIIVKLPQLRTPKSRD
jgi:hypothetical protein